LTIQVTLPEIKDDEQRLLNGLLQQLEFRQTRNHLRDCFYDGRLAVNQVGTIIPPQYYHLPIVLGWSAKAVDTLANRCNLDSFTWADGDLSSLGFHEVFDDNYLDVEIDSATTQSLLHGPAFLINTVGDTTVGEPAGSVHVKSATNATGTWDARGRRMSNLLSITGRDLSGSVSSLALYLDGVTIIGEKDSSGWSTERTEHPWGVPVEPMVYRYRTDRPFGQSRISRAVMSAHEAALRTVIRMEGHADTYSFPEMWMLGADESIFKNPDGTQKASWQVMLGRVKGIPDDEEATNPRVDVKQFQASSPQPHIDMLKQQAQLFAGVTDIPISDLGVSDMSNPTSSDSYIASRENIIAEAENTIKGYKRALKRSMTRALAMQNNIKDIPAEWSTISPKWRPPIYLSQAQQADAGLKMLTACPWLAETDVGLEILGLDEQQIARALSQKVKAQGQLTLQALAQQGQNLQATQRVEQATSDSTSTN